MICGIACLSHGVCVVLAAIICNCACFQLREMESNGNEAIRSEQAEGLEDKTSKALLIAE